MATGGCGRFLPWTKQAQTLSKDDSVVLALPVSAVLAQRMRLPSVEGSELREMVRIQLEKALPFSAEEVT
jgi:Tfp pilus assembly PilM family ATPase